VSTLTTLLLLGILFIAVASLIALIYAVAHAEEGFEDSTGYHRKEQNSQGTNPSTSTVDTGNPWDQINGANCPINLSHTIGSNQVHQP
jgi:hypothetical protein